MKADELMQHSVLTASPDTTLTVAWLLMEDHRIRHLPVVSDNRLVGLVTDRDIRSATPTTPTPLAEAAITVYMGTTTIATCMTQDVITVGPDVDIRLATRMILDRRIGCLPVLRQDQLVGILTEIDLLRGYLLAHPSAAGHVLVTEAMQDFLITTTPEDLVSTAYQRMQGGLVRHLPIVDESDKLVGILTDRDIRQARGGGDTIWLGQAQGDAFGMMTVSDLMTTQAVTVRQDSALTKAAELFLTHKFGCLPIIHQDGKLEGLLTVTDLLDQYVAQGDLDATKL